MILAASFLRHFAAALIAFVLIMISLGLVFCKLLSNYPPEDDE